jgi:hypothetical protein
VPLSIDCGRVRRGIEIELLARFSYKKSGTKIFLSSGESDGRGQYLDSNGNRVNVGNCDANGVNINNWNDDDPNDNIGVGAARKS